MKLSEDSIRWAIKHLAMESDTDLFPIPKEIMIIKESIDQVVAKLSNIDYIP